MGIDRGAVVEEVQRTVDIEVQRLGHTVRLRDVLGLQRLHQVAQDGHILRSGVCEVGLVDLLHRPVDDRLFDGLQSRLAPHDELAEGKHEVAFQRQGVLLVRVVKVDVQGVEVVGAGRGQLDDLSAQPAHQGRIVD